MEYFKCVHLLDKVADEIQDIRPCIALEIDRISDHLERVSFNKPSKEEALRIVAQAFKGKPKEFVSLIKKIVGLFKSHKKRKAGFFSSLRSLANFKVITALLVLLSSYSSAQNMLEDVSEKAGWVENVEEQKEAQKPKVLPLTAIGVKPDIEDASELKGAQPKDFMGEYPIVDAFLGAQGNKWNFGRSNSFNAAVKHGNNMYGIGVGVSKNKSEAIQKADRNAKKTYGKSVLDRIIEPSDSSWYVAISISGAPGSIEKKERAPKKKEFRFEEKKEEVRDVFDYLATPEGKRLVEMAINTLTGIEDTDKDKKELTEKEKELKWRLEHGYSFKG